MREGIAMSDERHRGDAILLGDGAPFIPGMTLWDESGASYPTAVDAEIRSHRDGDWSVDSGEFRSIRGGVAYPSHSAALKARAGVLRRDSEAAMRLVGLALKAAERAEAEWREQAEKEAAAAGGNKG
jgi:hypothetical protein